MNCKKGDKDAVSSQQYSRRCTQLYTQKVTKIVVQIFKIEPHKQAGEQVSALFESQALFMQLVQGEKIAPLFHLAILYKTYKHGMGGVVVPLLGPIQTK